jgi:hypothetical protein
MSYLYRVVRNIGDELGAKAMGLDRSTAAGPAHRPRPPSSSIRRQYRYEVRSKPSAS